MARNLLLVLLSVITIGLYAQTTVEVGQGTDNSIAPVYPYYGYTVSQQIYTQEELENAGFSDGAITHIAFQANNSTIPMTTASDWLIYMGETDLATFTIGNWVPLEQMEQVYRGFVHTGPLYAGEWITIELETPFTYLGLQNLVVYVNEFVDGDEGSSSYRFRGTSLSANRTIYNYNDNDAYTPEGPKDWTDGSNQSASSVRPNIKITFSHQPTDGLDLAISAFTAPAVIPGTFDMQIKVTNKGTDPVSENEYTIEIYETGESEDTLLYTIEATEGLDGFTDDVFTSHTYYIPVEVYSGWDYASPEGAITLKATVILNGDETSYNDSRLLTATLRPVYDIAVSSVAGPKLIPTVHPLTVVLQNNGRSAVAEGSYLINILADEAPLLNITGENIDLASSKTFTIPANTLNQLLANLSGNFTFNILVTSEISETDDTNNTGSCTSEIFDGDFTTEAIAEVGISGTVTQNTIPFSMYYQDSISQSIYRASDFGNLEAGIITHLNYKVTIGNVNNMPQTYPVSIYMANYAKPDGFTHIDDWVAGTEFFTVALDYDLPVHQSGTYDFWIALDTPFFYEGGDLIVMTFKDHDYDTGNSNLFFQSPNTEQRLSLYKRKDNYGDPFDPADPTVGGPNTTSGTMLTYRPQTRFAFTMQGYGVVSGTVTDRYGEPIEGATVSLSEPEKVITTGADGFYSLLVDVTSEAQIVFSAIGCIPSSVVINELAWSGDSGLQTVTYDTSLLPALDITVKGTVVFADSGLPASGVTVYLGQFSGETDSDGYFEIPDVFADAAYHVTVSTDLAGYQDFASDIYIDYELDVIDGEYTLDIALLENVRSPLYVRASLTDAGQEINWFRPAPEKRISLENEGDTAYRYGYGTFIAAHRYTSEMLTEMGAVGSYLTMVGFVPYETSVRFSIMVWTGEDLANPDVNNPTHSQPISGVIAQTYNYYLLDTPVFISETDELVIGIGSTDAQIKIDGLSSQRLEGYGNKYYYNGGWTTMHAVSSAYWEHWRIAGYVILTDAERSLSRTFGEKYNIYRFTEGETMESAVLVNNLPISSPNLRLSYIESDLLSPAVYQYAVTAIYTGDNYPLQDDGEHWLESEPSYANLLSRPIIVSGVVVDEEGEAIPDVTITLINQNVGYSSSPVFSDTNGAFCFPDVMPFTYQILVSSAEPEYSYTHPDYITVSDEHITALVITIPNYLSGSDSNIKPLVTALKGNYPNPFNPTTTISFALAKDGHVVLDIFNIKGQRVKTLLNEEVSSGLHKIIWNGDDQNGRTVGSGVYFYKMTTNEYDSTRKMLLLK